MPNQLSITELILDADVIVQIVMLILIIASILSWTVIFSKKSTLLKEKKLIKTFNKTFDINNKVDDCYDANANDFITQTFNDAKTELVFDNGVEIAYRKINTQINNRIGFLEKNLSTLATIASSSPYIGLFGTVWGIMHSFISLASVKQATIAIVAPGIAEALIATAFGLFAAIPANIFYNKLTTEVDTIQQRYQSMIEDFLVVMQRDTITK